MSEEISNDAFYLRALPKPRGEIWYYNGPVGRETLGNVIKKITRKAGFEGHLTNHSLRRRTPAISLKPGELGEEHIHTIMDTFQEHIMVEKEHLKKGSSH